MTEKTQLQRALEYAGRGWAVLPIFGLIARGIAHVARDRRAHVPVSTRAR